MNIILPQSSKKKENSIGMYTEAYCNLTVPAQIVQVDLFRFIVVLIPDLGDALGGINTDDDRRIPQVVLIVGGQTSIADLPLKRPSSVHVFVGLQAK